MEFVRYLARRLISALLLLVGVTLISFLLMVYFGPDAGYHLAGQHASPERVAEIRRQLGHDLPFFPRYVEYLRQLATLDLGHSISTGESIQGMLARTVPTSIALILPGFLLGNLLGMLLAIAAALRRGSALDRLIIGVSTIGMSVSFVVIIVALQILLCTPYGLNIFPVRGWETDSLSAYLHHVAVPTLALVLTTVGYNTRFYRSVLVEELGRPHVTNLRALGQRTWHIVTFSVIPNSLIPILTRLLFSVPLLIIGGSLLIENQFGIPGIGKVTFDAITNGDQMVLKAVVGITAVLFALATVLADLTYRLIDPRVETP